MKKLSVVVAGTGQIKDIEIEPGTTAKDILDQLGLQDYLLSKGQTILSLRPPSRSTTR